ncbi:MAG TPA: phosphoglycolate phosphatase [Zoogloea sp.]|uniref:phosphoglycolate phosphatase n=1 Tax=Zoogloea sp. TaxID=49181 RepID=UPI002C8DDF9E|nr:phosphoglycolate phosphatase [Zoogloea sp.]HMV17095.1 phosphoglycolate phosphatase [Rhodocyclaceae bacterium]HMV64012.1 phosphoglycolate phosphatase [Rhodocyclaceae bacterium]HMW51380.1 phosphoglycolate phosphatase [Rhodocyclaceae bacterium]HMZ75840.1 phosphoglycolate phosphatase [Rhodocyclaceae bacterium]HNA66219.1 phosphoglycolate phosphatase [Rhodocyclaceae bacterium]
MSPRHAVLFDLDGTLLDSIPDLAEACQRMMRELGHPPHDLETIRSFVGKGMVNLVTRCLGDASAEAVDAAVAVFRRHYAAVNGDATTLYPGVVPALEALAARGVPLACVTNKPAAFTEPLLARCGIADYFAVTVSGDTLAEKKPHPAPLQHACRLLGVAPAAALMVGDSANDAEAARAAGMPVLLVTYGYSEGRPVDSIDCDGLLSSLEDVLRHLPA